MKLLVLDLLCLNNEERQIHYLEKVFAKHPELNVEMRAVEVYKDGLKKEDILWADKIVTSGSIKSAYSELDWGDHLKRGFDWIIEMKVPTHAICFGAQFLAQQLGSKVELHPKGAEFGAVPIFLTEEGRKHAIMQEFKDGETVHTSHSDFILETPKGATLLAFNDHTEVQAYQYENIFATQFHTDLPTEVMEMILDMRKAAGRINLRDQAHYDEIKMNLPRGEMAHQLMKKFLMS